MSLLRSLYRGVMNRLPDEFVIRFEYLRHVRRIPNLKVPKTLNEKINWRKLHQRDPRFTRCSDKHEGKGFIREILGEGLTVPTLWVGRSPDQIPFDEIVPPYVVKSTNSSQDTVIVRSRAGEDRAGIREQMRRSLAEPHHVRGREWGYAGIEPRIIVERMLQTDDGESPLDYRFYVFHGRTECIIVSKTRGRWAAHSFFDRDLNRLPVHKRGYEQVVDVHRPACFPDMLAAAERLGREFDFVRVDMYACEGRYFIGELTFYPVAGYYVYEPRDWDEKLGRFWRLPATR